MTSVLQSIFKKDDDARALQDSDGSIYLETNQPVVTVASVADDASRSIDTFVKDTMLNDRLLDDAIVEPMPDIRVKTLMYMFMANATVMLMWFLVGSTLFYWSNVWSAKAMFILIGVSVAAFVFAYVLMLCVRLTHPRVALACLCGWAVSAALLVGAAAALVHKVAPIQFTLLVLVQCFVMMAYTKLSPRYVSSAAAALYMFLFTLCVWALFVFAFVEERDWAGGITILALSILTLLYHTWQIRIVEGRYSLSASDIQLSVIQFYGDLFLICAK